MYNFGSFIMAIVQTLSKSLQFTIFTARDLFANTYARTLLLRSTFTSDIYEWYEIHNSNNNNWIISSNHASYEIENTKYRTIVQHVFGFMFGCGGSHRLAIIVATLWLHEWTWSLRLLYYNIRTRSGAVSISYTWCIHHSLYAFVETMW